MPKSKDTEAPAAVSAVEESRPEDAPLEGAPVTPLSAKEVPLEKSRKDESSLLATDTLVIHDDGTIEKVPA